MTTRSWWTLASVAIAGIVILFATVGSISKKMQ